MNIPIKLYVSQKCQVVIPKLIRQQIKLGPRMAISIQAIDDHSAIITTQPINYAKAMRGLGKNVWKKLGGTEKYLKQERASWGK